MDSEDYQTNFHENRRMKMDAVKIVNKINKEHGTIKNVYFLACGGSLVDLYPGYYFVRAESAVMDAQWIPAREFALTPPKKLGKDSLLIICSHSGKTKECLEAAKTGMDAGAAVVTMTHAPGSPCDTDKWISVVYDWAPGVKEALAHFHTDDLRLYPDPVVTNLVDGIAQFYQVDPSQVFVGVGSDDVLAMLFMTFFNSKKPILFPDITYSFYDVWAEMLRIPYTQIPLDDAFRLNPSDYKCENGGIVFPNPNAPTGELLPVSAIEEIIQANPDVIVIVDEAYIDFGGESALPLIDKYDNVIVVQTFSKSRSLAGSRIGFAISNPTLIKYLNDVKYSFNSYTMDRITIALGTASIRDRAYFEQTTEKIIKTREWTKEQLRALGFVFGDSKSNFIFAMHPDVSGVELFEALKKNDIYVRHFGKPARINEYLRITIGTDEQMHKLIDFLKKYLNK